MSRLIGVQTGGIVSNMTVTGGTIYTAAPYKYHLFTAGSNLQLSGSKVVNTIRNSIIPPSSASTASLTSLNVEYLIVAGGGSGSSCEYAATSGGAGGAGGVRSGTTTCTVATGTYAVVVGIGGAGVTTASPGNHSVAGNSGTDSTFNGITSHGGGRGGENNSSATVGGSGGGGGGGAGTLVGAAGTGGEGFSGGTATGSAPNFGAGGGGAGGTATGTYSEIGGLATYAFSSWLTDISNAVGVTGAFAGGGGGGGGTNLGGGGGASSGSAFNTANALYGSGSGGSSSSTSGNTGNGGNGFVLLRWKYQ